MFNTATKVRLARILSATVRHLGVRARREIRRGGIAYEVDLHEGIDLSLFLFGTFQRHVLRTIQKLVPADGVLLDVGANIGAIALPVAAHLSEGHVYAFEPTDFAYAKLARNIELNPELAERITLIKSLVADRTAEHSELVAYSSWPLDESPQAHPVHKGLPKPLSCGQTTIDAFVAERALAKVSFVKIDTDGHEFAVLSGAADCLRNLRPIVLFEACEYLMKPPRPTFADFEALFGKAGYEICDGDRMETLAASDFYDRCPRGGGLDLIAVPVR